jgi:AraC-like DNA-binding protein
LEIGNDFSAQNIECVPGMTDQQYPRVYLYRRIVQAKLFIDRHYGNRVDIDNISDEAYFSKFHFIRLFKQIYGKTPYQYLTSVRIEQAMKLLRKGLSVSEVCHSVGFESLSSFSSLFKKHTGNSPSSYLLQQMNSQRERTQQPFKFIPSCYARQNGWIEE